MIPPECTPLGISFTWTILTFLLGIVIQRCLSYKGRVNYDTVTVVPDTDNLASLVLVGGRKMPF